MSINIMKYLRVNKKGSKGFSLIEAMVATAIVSIGFVGVFSLVATSEQFTMRAIAKKKMQMVADQIMDIVETDLDNIDSYAMSLTTCTAPATADQWVVRGYEWCIRLQDETGDAGTANTRAITITDLGDGRKVVQIVLEGFNQKVQIIVRKAFDV